MYLRLRIFLQSFVPLTIPYLDLINRYLTRDTLAAQIVYPQTHLLPSDDLLALLQLVKLDYLITGIFI